VRGVYDRHSYLAEKRDALERLANLVGEIIAGKHSQNGREQPPLEANAPQQWADHVDAVVRGKGPMRQSGGTASDQGSSVRRLRPRNRVRKARPERLRAAS
jgi:hypothetical protein